MEVPHLQICAIHRLFFLRKLKSGNLCLRFKQFQKKENIYKAMSVIPYLLFFQNIRSLGRILKRQQRLVLTVY